MKCGLLGRSLPHSLSPYLHAILGDNEYALFEMEEEEVEAFIRSDKWDAINVTIPYKKTVMPFCDTLSERARMIGSVNTMVRRDGKIYGDNADFEGFCDMAAGISFRGKKVAVLGSGGASVTVQAAAKYLGCREIVVVSRSGECRYSDVDKYADAEILVNTTPVGMFPHNDGSPISLDLFQGLEAVLDLIYNPLRTRLILDAISRGIPVRGGLRMLCTQAHVARRVFTDGVPPVSADALYSSVLRAKENVVFIGMPGSGKSTFARMIAERYKKELLDTDEMIVKDAGMTIPEIFEKYGEEHFRLLEKKAIADACRRMGCVIATGGGAILNPDNRLEMKSGGFVIWLDCPVDRLAMGGRPLSSSPDKVKKLYSERADIYRSLGDVRIEVTADNSRNIGRIISAIEQRYKGAL